MQDAMLHRWSSEKAGKIELIKLSTPTYIVHKCIPFLPVPTSQVLIIPLTSSTLFGSLKIVAVSSVSKKTVKSKPGNHRRWSYSSEVYKLMDQPVRVR